MKTKSTQYAIRKRDVLNRRKQPFIYRLYLKKKDSDYNYILNYLYNNCHPKSLCTTIKKKYPKIYNILETIRIDNNLHNNIESIYWYLNDIKKIPLCKCNNKLTWISAKRVYGIENLCGKCATIKHTAENNLKKYGVKSTSQLDSIKKKIRNSNMKKYGKPYAFQSENIKEKIKKTNIEKYGVEFSSQRSEWKDQVNETLIKKHGSIDNYNIHKYNKTKETCLEKYGADHHLMDKDVIKKRESTCMEKYGATNCMGNDEVRKKVSDSYYKNSDFISYMKRLIINRGYELISEYIDSHSNITLLCKQCNNKFDITWNSFQQGAGICPNCNPVSISHAELELRNYINEELNIDTINNNRKLLKEGKELDIYIPSKNIAIEYCGLAFHSTYNNAYNNTPKNYHIDKYNNCKEKGIRLITIFEDEWILKNDVVKSILKNILTNRNIKIRASKCEIKLVNYKDRHEFMNNYHLQGDRTSTICIGLFYKNELISAMSFTNKGNYKWELDRLCTKSNYMIYGGSSRILKYFKINYEWSVINTYADLRWSIGNVYKTLGFNYLYNTSPNYWYWGKGIKGRSHRLNYSKNKLENKVKIFDSNKTEFQIMAENNYGWIYDCGNMKFELRRKKPNSEELG